MASLRPSTKSLEIVVSGDPEMPQGPSDTVSGLKWSPTGNFLAVSSWDNTVKMYEVDPNSGNGQGRAMYSHEKPALSVGWWADGSKVFSGGCDNAVRSFDVASGQAAQVGAHDQPVSSVALVDVGQPMIASTSWDKTLKYWDLRQQQPVATITLPERGYSLASQKKLLVVGCASQQLVTIDLERPDTIFKTQQSPLRHQTQIVSCQVDGSGYAVGTIEGRCALQYVAPDKASSNFSFKCHRQSVGTTTKPVDLVFAVDALDFHPVFNTLITGGADGTFHLWDHSNRHRLSYVKAFGEPVTAVSFNQPGTLLAYATGYDWSKGHSFNTPGKAPRIKVHKVNEWEVKPKARR